MANEQVIKTQEAVFELRDKKQYIVRPLTMNKLIEVWPIIERLEQATDKVSMDLLSDITKLTDVALEGQLSAGVKSGDLVDMQVLSKMLPILVGSPTVK